VTGSLPIAYGAFVNIQYLTFGDTDLITGTVPTEFGLLRTLERFTIDDPGQSLNITGPVPSSLMNTLILNKGSFSGRGAPNLCRIDAESTDIADSGSTPYPTCGCNWTNQEDRLSWVCPSGKLKLPFCAAALLASITNTHFLFLSSFPTLSFHSFQAQLAILARRILQRLSTP
jgi:hypothetical protein